jgi:hypothetical protein
MPLLDTFKAEQESLAFIADFRGRKLTHTGCESRVLESDREIVQP